MYVFLKYIAPIIECVFLASPAMLFSAIISGAILVARQKKKPLSIFHFSIILLFACYCAGVGATLFVPNNFWNYLFRGYIEKIPELFSHLGHYDFIPSFVSNPYSGIQKLFSLDGAGNVILFIPLGIFINFLWNKTRVQAFVVALGICVLVELIQPLWGRIFDIDDIIFYVVGIIAGAILSVHLIQPLHNHIKKSTRNGGPKNEKT